MLTPLKIILYVNSSEINILHVKYSMIFNMFSTYY